MKAGRLLVAALVTAAGMALLAWASAVPLRHHDAAAALRLSWSARPERIEVCRVTSEEELAKLAPHMRQRVQCEGINASYSLSVQVDDDPALERVVRGAGLRNDRPLYLLSDYPVPIGEHRIRISLTRRESPDTSAAVDTASGAFEADTGVFRGRAGREIDERSRRNRAAIPAVLSIDTVVTFASRRVALVTFNADTRKLDLRIDE